MLLFALVIGVGKWRRSHFRELRRRDRRVRRWQADAGPVRAIADAQPGLCRLRGVARILRGAEHYPELGAYLAWSVGAMESRTVDAEGREMRTMTGTFSERAGCGRFAITDGSGVAIVDATTDFEIWRMAGGFLEQRFSGALEVRDGSEVEIVAVGRRAPAADDARELANAGYRERGQNLLLESTPDRPVLILVRAAALSAATMP
jgi:hypothetical protein